MKGSQSRQPTAAVIAAVFLFAMAAPARGVDGVSISVGSDASSKVSVDPYRIGVQWSWNKRWLDSGNWYVGGYWDLLAGFWDNTSADRASSAIWELGLTPVFRIRQNRMLAFSPHFEFGVG
ncbi:MAG: hypothetical protein GTO41_23225, partial [Burkholderiales bacterium]|nr:hypothetical protein [Burkholderiales bacterium]